MEFFKNIEKEAGKSIEQITMPDPLTPKQIIDIFPYTISDESKFQQTELYFQAALKNRAIMKQFLAQESKFLNLFSCLWLYDDVYAAVCLHSDNIKNNFLAKRSKKEICAFVKSKINDSHLFKVNDILLLKSTVLIGTRQIGLVHLFFKKAEMLVEISNLSTLVSYYTPKSKEYLKSLVSDFGLFLRDN